MFKKKIETLKKKKAVRFLDSRTVKETTEKVTKRYFIFKCFC